MADGNPVIFSPYGGRFEFGQQKNDRSRTVTKWMRTVWFPQFADFLIFHELGLHCALCHLTPALKEPWRHWGECSGHKAAEESSVGQSVVKTDDGLAWITGRRVPRVELQAKHMEWLRQAADVLPHFDLGVHCMKCHSDLAGLNSDRDAVYSTSCGCREFIGVNRDAGGFALLSETRH